MTYMKDHGSGTPTRLGRSTESGANCMSLLRIRKRVAVHDSLHALTFDWSNGRTVPLACSKVRDADLITSSLEFFLFFLPTRGCINEHEVVTLSSSRPSCLSAGQSLLGAMQAKEGEAAGGAAGVWIAVSRLLRGRQPAVPESRQPSPEHRAGLWSLVTFSWMSSIMAVSVPVSTKQQPRTDGVTQRQAIAGLWNSVISGFSIRNVDHTICPQRCGQTSGRTTKKASRDLSPELFFKPSRQI